MNLKAMALLLPGAMAFLCSNGSIHGIHTCHPYCRGRHYRRPGYLFYHQATFNHPAELETLRCYLELEALRMDHAFTYTIDISPDIDIGEMMIPPMLIQPYAENAIKHGLKHAAPGGRLSIGIHLEDGWMVCSITDNGIGRKKAANAGNRPHRPRGMEVTKNRLDVLSSLSRQRYGLDVVDLTGDEGLPLGTQVNIRIPISTHPPFQHSPQRGKHIYDTRDNSR